MAEYTASAAQTVAQGGNVLFTSTAVKGGNCIRHREGSGLVTLRGLTNQCNARFFVDFGGNIAIPAGGAVQEISLAIAINGEPLASSIMRATPAATANYFNVSGSAYIDVPKGCCCQISVQNATTESILVEGANLIVTRVS